MNQPLNPFVRLLIIVVTTAVVIGGFWLTIHLLVLHGYTHRSVPTGTYTNGRF